MIRISKNLLRAVGFGAAFVAILLGLVALQHYRPQSSMPAGMDDRPRDPFLSSQTRKPTETMEGEEIPLLSQQRPTLMPDATPTPLSTWMKFNGQDLLGAPVLLQFEPACGGEDIVLPVFEILSWRSGILESEEFDLGTQTAVAWDHQGYTGLWMHSGLGWWGEEQTAYPLQEYLERHKSGRLNTPEEFDLKAAQCLIGSEVVFEISGEKVSGTVSALVRVPAAEVAEVSGHVMDLVPYLAETYPESGFGELDEGGLVLYFCGRQLSTEAADMSAGYYSQTRIIVGIAP